MSPRKPREVVIILPLRHVAVAQDLLTRIVEASRALQGMTRDPDMAHALQQITAFATLASQRLEPEAQP